MFYLDTALTCQGNATLAYLVIASLDEDLAHNFSKIFLLC